ncbi:MAG: sulfur carrier protein ThiS [Gammaproteobacteria bacterium]|nr:sulfur carrier protein ThiS [Gammaproteobacteria bacterium]
MEIVVNGVPRQVAEDYTVANLIADMGLQGRRLAVEVNLEIVPRSLHAAQRFSSGDKVEIVHAIGGG